MSHLLTDSAIGLSLHFGNLLAVLVGKGISDCVGPIRKAKHHTARASGICHGGSPKYLLELIEHANSRPVAETHNAD
jgi:hypothetical protein